MSPIPDTRISLILRLAAAEDVEAWREFAAVYAPAVLALARRRGLQAADAEDFLQELLLAVARAAGQTGPGQMRQRGSQRNRSAWQQPADDAQHGLRN